MTFAILYVIWAFCCSKVVGIFLTFYSLKGIIQSQKNSFFCETDLLFY